MGVAAQKKYNRDDLITQALTELERKYLLRVAADRPID
jgi:hypothetical protein